MQNKKYLFALIFLIFGLSFLPACKKHSASPEGSSQAGKTLYQCAMHPQIVSDKPGECPICHMRLIPIENGSVQKPAASGPKKILFYRNPMNPSATSPVPMKD